MLLWPGRPKNRKLHTLTHKSDPGQSLGVAVRAKIIAATAILSLLALPEIQAQDPELREQGARRLAPEAPLFASPEILRFSLEADWGTIFKDRNQESEYHPAKLYVQGVDGFPLNLDLRVRTRGNFRLQSRICAFPPLRLDFPKEVTANTPFAGQNKLKLATHCQDNRERYQQITLQEYLIYRTFNLLTDRSFRVRLARITYIDAAGKRDTLSRYGFLIEDEKAMAARLGGSVLELEGVHDDNTDQEQMTLVAVFQYFIGNTDWSVWALHNIVLVEIPANDFSTAVPYDFDWSGVIEAPYARPDARLPIRSIRERLYRGYCKDRAQLEPVFALFKQKKDAIYALWRAQEGLDEKTLKRSLAYFDQFYQTIDDPKAVEREFIRSCR